MKQSATVEEMKEVLQKVAQKLPLTLWEQDEYSIWLQNQTDQVQAVAALEEKVQQLSGVMGTIMPAGQPTVTKLSQISKNLGDMVAGRFIAPASAATSTEPTAAGFTGTAMSGDGETFGADTYHIVGVNAGVLQFGLSATTGKALAGAGAVILDADGITVKAASTTPYVTFKDASGNTVATIFQDDAQNLQFDLANVGQRFTFNDGDIIVLRATGQDPAVSLHENDVLKANMFWDASDLNLVLANYINTGGVVLAVNPTSGGGAGLWVMRDGTASVDRFRFSNSDNGFGLYEVASDPAYIDGYAILYHLNTGAVKLRVKQGAVETEYTLSGTWLASDADYSDISANDAATDVTGAELEELTDGSATTLHSHSGLTNSSISPTTADITLTVNTRYFVNASGLTADRALKFPSASDGDRIEIRMVGENASYACTLQGDTSIVLEGLTATEWDRLWNSGQAISFVYLTGDGWRVLSDKRTFWRHKVLTGTASSIDFSNIPPRAKNIAIDWVARSDKASSTLDLIYVRFNGDTGANYDSILVALYHSAGLATTETLAATSMFVAQMTGSTAPAGVPGSGHMWIPGYSSTTFHKQLQNRSGMWRALSTTNERFYDGFANWSSTAAINQITFLSPADNFIAGSQFTIYLT